MASIDSFGWFSVSMSIGGKIRHAIESIVTVFLFLFQYIPLAGPWYGFMCIPLVTYVFSVLWLSDSSEINLYPLFYSKRLMFGRIVAIAGFVMFLTAFIQYLHKRSYIKKHGGFINSGFYSVLRHPQYFGIIVCTLGITIMCIQYAASHIDFWVYG